MTKARILIVEDEVIVARDIGQQLTELGFEPVGSCITGEEAVRLAEQLRPDLVLMDIQLAGAMDGISAAQQIRERLGLPVVFLTAFAETETLGRAKQAEPFGYIIKPFDERELRTVVEVALYKHEAEDRLRESEERFRLFVETSLDAVLLITADGEILTANAAACAIFRLTAAQLRLAGRRGLMDPADARLTPALDELMRTGRFRGELTLLRGDGEPFPAEISSVLFRTTDGQERTSMVIRDVSARLKAEQTLHLQGEALAAAANAIVITNSAGIIQWANAAFTRLTGYELGEAVGLTPRDLINSGVQTEAFYREMWETITAGRVWHQELVNRRKDGSTYSEEMTITPVRDAAGAIAHFIAIKQDITARKQVEETLRQNEERYRLLFDRNPRPMWLVDDEQLRFLAVNDTAVRHYGYTREDFLGMTADQLRPAEDREQYMEKWRELRTEPFHTVELRHRRKDGVILHVEVISQALLFQGRSARLVMAEDITEKKQLQAQFLRAQRLESLGMLASGIAHDLNNMLAPIMLAGPFLRTSLSSPRELQFIETLEKSAERGSGLVRQILAFAQGSANAALVTHLKHIARDVFAIIECTFPKNISLRQNVDRQAWPVQANPTQIHQVLLNLCVNARDAMPKGGTLSLNVFNRTLTAADAAAIAGARAGNWLVIEVCDTGLGIAPDVLPRIWDAFFTTKTPDKGTGLGLATVRSIVTAHLGFLQLDTVLGQGTTFRVFLPAQPEQDARSEQGVPPATRRGRNEFILVVDDEVSVREVVAAILLRHGFQVLTCADGIEAIVKYNARSGDIALVITDVDMPNLDGAILAGTLRRINPALKLIAMSGLSANDASNEAVAEIRTLAQTFLLKPFSTAELLEAVDTVLHPSPAP